MTTSRRSLFLAIPMALALVLGLHATPARADLSKKVIAAFKGKIVVTKSPVESVGDDKATIAAIKKNTVTEVVGAAGGDDVWSWTFVYTAFLNKAGAPSLKLEFYDGTKYVADQTLTNVDPKMTVLEGEVSITEDDGLTKGKKYTLKLVGTVKGKESVLATTVLDMK
jgi:ethanolamine utilization protein EutQ (cupin superfamily)